MADKRQIEEWITSYGIDSDFVRVRVLSQFPRTGNVSFISPELVNEAVHREVEASRYDPIVMGVDVARFGDDQTVLFLRRGLDAKSIPPVKLRGKDTQEVAAFVADMALKYEVDAIFVDGGAMGPGVIDRLRHLRFTNVHDINFGSKPVRSQVGDDAAISTYFNRRAEMHGLMKEWLRHGAIPNDPELVSDLTNLQYSYRMSEGRDCIILEKKEDMKARGLGQHTEDALKALVAVVNDASNSMARVRAADILLCRGWGAPEQVIENKTSLADVIETAKRRMAANATSGTVVPFPAATTDEDEQNAS